MAKERLVDRLTGRNTGELHAVSVRIAADAALVFGDEALLEQVLYNLLDNAAKYSPPGSPIEIEAERRSGAVQIWVADHAPGVPDDKKERIFDLFFRVERGDNRVAGTGLGLVIVHGFVEAMGGTIRVIRRPDGEGAIFEVMLPQPNLPAVSEEARASV